MSLLLPISIHFLLILRPQRLPFKRKAKLIKIVLLRINRLNTLMSFTPLTEQFLGLELWQGLS